MIKVVFFCMILSFFVSYSEAKNGDRSIKQTVEYTIPVSKPELEPYSHYKFKIKWISQTPGHRAIKYDLPFELDGLGQGIELTEDTPNHFTGLYATAECDETSSLRCRIHYHDINKNPEEAKVAAKAVILATYKDTTFQQGRIEVMESFMSDPEPDGVMLFDGPLP